MERPPQAEWIPHPHSLETQDLFQPLQLGFCCKHSCSALLAQLTDLWFSAINRSDLSKDVFLDLKTHTFDLVAHKILLSKLFVSLYSLNSLSFSVHILKIEYNASLFMVPTLLKELLNMVYQKGQSWNLFSSASILMTHSTYTIKLCKMSYASI